MDPRLRRIAQRIRGRSLRNKVIKLLEKPAMQIEGRIYTGLPLEEAPASISHHHNYPGGFLEHIIAVSELSLNLCEITRRVYRCKIDTDLVLCGALLHDIFKPLTYVRRPGGGYRSSPLAERIDHLSLITSELVRRDFPLEAIHVICASHGYEHGPIGPRTLEALISHLADLIESRLNGDVLSAAKYLIREATGEEPRFLTGKDAFRVVRAKTELGWDGVRDIVRQIKVIANPRTKGQPR